MPAMSAQPNRRQRRWPGRGLLALAGVYLLLLIPDVPPPTPAGAGKQSFLGLRDAFWSGLENEFQQARGKDPALLSADFHQTLARNWQLLSTLTATNLPPNDPAFGQLETNFFLLAPKAAACGPRIPLEVFLQTYSELRRQTKRQSEHWPMDSTETRERLYRCLYGARAALEEALLQIPRDRFPAFVPGDDEPSATPSATVRDVTMHSGDILVSRGGAATSALIARGNDFPGNFSHVALVHVDEATKQVSVIESHIESGVGVSSIEKYLADTKLRIMALRLRADLPQLAADPLLPHKAASLAVSNAFARHIPYDFTMDYHDASKLFCSEVAAAAYQPFGVRLWMGISHLSSPGVTSWLAALGARHFETQEPSDLEYDPQLRVVAEWRDPETLFKDHLDNAVIDVMLEAAERGEKLGYNRWQLPGARLAKAWSWAKNQLGRVGPIPEGMSASTALRVQRLKASHAALAARLHEQADRFRAERGYVPPYWELVRLAREAREEQISAAQAR